MNLIEFKEVTDKSECKWQVVLTLFSISLTCVLKVGCGNM